MYHRFCGSLRTLTPTSSWKQLGNIVEHQRIACIIHNISVLDLSSVSGSLHWKMCCFLTVRRLTQVLAAKNALWGIFMAGLTWLKECPSHTHFFVARIIPQLLFDKSGPALEAKAKWNHTKTHGNTSKSACWGIVMPWLAMADPFQRGATLSWHEWYERLKFPTKIPVDEACDDVSPHLVRAEWREMEWQRRAEFWRICTQWTGI